MRHMGGLVGGHPLAVTPPSSSCSMPPWTLLSASAKSLACKYACSHQALTSQSLQRPKAQTCEHGQDAQSDGFTSGKLWRRQACLLVIGTTCCQTCLETPPVIINKSDYTTINMADSCPDPHTFDDTHSMSSCSHSFQGVLTLTYSFRHSSCPTCCLTHLYSSVKTNSKL